MSFNTRESLYNDETINKFMNLIVKRGEGNIYAFDSFFIPSIKRRGIDIINAKFKHDVFSKNLLMAPLNINNNHWIIAIVDVSQKEIIVYDSLDCHNGKEVKILQYFLCEHKHTKYGTSSPWFLFRGETTNQENEYDCGPWILAIADRYSSGQPPMPNQKLMAGIRKEHE
ncbi:sentrin-specific protease 2-like [Daktulosphaira vitifoliae]|uniref:sentrin-specific protease 2-like n=1 Tax=Daktulosphaira vitifoliae TaxID=58002 RepID=UPI0021A9FE76|nr:sentrin-specific protease 2-like [Daktulosphaira vitifoliae]